jgi:hypothetical protein
MKMKDNFSCILTRNQWMTDLCRRKSNTDNKRLGTKLGASRVCYTRSGWSNENGSFPCKYALSSTITSARDRTRLMINSSATIKKSENSRNLSMRSLIVELE